MSVPPPFQLRDIVRAALAEDLGSGDVTSLALFPASQKASGTIRVHEDAVIAGVAVAVAVFSEAAPDIRVTQKKPDGARVRTGMVILQAVGDARTLLMAERVALNFLQRLSGIATLTARYCEAVRGYPTKILDTRKTTPGLRALEKWAVVLGGGYNHRMTLGDGILIKDNHLALLRSQGSDTAAACRLARERAPHGLKIIVECESLPQVRQALEGQADVLLLDNMTPAVVRQAVDLVKGRALIEASGGMTLARAREMAQAGADFVSVGALTHSAPAVNLSFDLSPLSRKRTKRS
jgi:nicotinate-nucleotide pyrophosphorylase (carboxylating)